VTQQNHSFRSLIITGGSSGIGEAILKRFLCLYPDARVINLSRSAPKISHDDARVEHYTVDLRNRAEVSGAITRIKCKLNEKSRQGPVLLVNNSGIGQHARFQDLPASQHLETIDLNLCATLQLTINLLPELLHFGGKIVTVSSTSAYQPTPRMATYGASKCFLRNWSLALGEDLRDTKVSTLCLCPGVTETPFIAKAGFRRGVRSPFGVQTVEKVVDALYKAIASNRSLIIPGCRNRAIAWLAATVPIQLSTRSAAWLMDWAKKYV
jgi:uncharacterized protein